MPRRVGQNNKEVQSMQRTIIIACAIVTTLAALCGWYYQSLYTECHAATATLRAQVKADKARSKVADVEREAAAKEAKAKRSKASSVIQTVPAVPDDSCASAADIIGKYQRGQL